MRYARPALHTTFLLSWVQGMPVAHPSLRSLLVPHQQAEASKPAPKKRGAKKAAAEAKEGGEEVSGALGADCNAACWPCLPHCCLRGVSEAVFMRMARLLACPPRLPAWYMVMPRQSRTWQCQRCSLHLDGITDSLRVACATAGARAGRQAPEGRQGGASAQAGQGVPQTVSARCGLICELSVRPRPRPCREHAVQALKRTRKQHIEARLLAWQASCT